MSSAKTWIQFFSSTVRFEKYGVIHGRGPFLLVWLFWAVEAHFFLCGDRSRRSDTPLISGLMFRDKYYEQIRASVEVVGLLVGYTQ